MSRGILFTSIFIYILLSIFIFNFSYNSIKEEESKLLNEKYSTISKHMKDSLSTLINDKKNATLVIAVSASKNLNIKEAILKNDSSKIDLKEFSLNLREETQFKNVWFQIIDKKGNSFYRSWTENKNDSLAFRPDVQKVLKDKKTLASISVGRYDMTFKSMVPISHNGKFLGIFEVITHFNSISKSLNEKKIDSIMLAHKKYKKRLTKPFTKMFLSDYYIANLDAKKNFINTIKANNIEKILKIDDYKILEEKVLTSFQLIEFEKETIGYVILAKDLKNIDISEIKKLTQTNLIYVIILIVLIALLFIMLSYYLHSRNVRKLNKKLEKNLKEIKQKKRENQIILDSQKNIIVITDGVSLQNANKQLLTFYDEFSSIEEFKEKYKCICETFVQIKDDDFYVIEKDYNGKNWAEHILANQDKKFKAAIYKKDKLHHFTVNVNLSLFENSSIPYIIVTLTDITFEIEQNEKIKQKDRILFQQSKMASMGEMLENIAHQWRQPLNSIATAASSLKLQKELNLVDNKQIDTSCEFILKNTFYLSQTIEDFKNFFKKDKEKEEFLLKELVYEAISLLKKKLEHNEIKVVLKIDENEKIYGFKNEFQQAMLNIINNSMDAFLSKGIKSKRLIIIEYKNKQLSIQDSAKGIKEELLNKIFEPYFTTKHQSQGTGIGLYMTEEILVKHMNCNIKVENKSFEFQKKSYFGLCFIITFN